MSKITDIAKFITGAGKTADELTESGEERQAVITERLKIDMASDNWLSKSIRPLTLIFLLICEGIIIIAGAMEVEVDGVITGQIGLLLGSAVGFYFDSKRRERIADKATTATIRMEKMKLKHEIRKERKASRKG